MDTTWNSHCLMMSFVLSIVIRGWCLLDLEISSTLVCVSKRRLHCTTLLIVQSGDILHVVTWQDYLQLLQRMPLELKLCNGSNMSMLHISYIGVDTLGEYRLWSMIFHVSYSVRLGIEDLSLLNPGKRISISFLMSFWEHTSVGTQS